MYSPTIEYRTELAFCVIVFLPIVLGVLVCCTHFGRIGPCLSDDVDETSSQVTRLSIKEVKHDWFTCRPSVSIKERHSSVQSQCNEECV